MEEKIEKSEEKWREKLSPEQYRIIREKGTEAPFSGKYYKVKDKGIYKCSACSNELFSSETKFDSGSGWPSFYDIISQDKVETRKDRSCGMARTEVVCAKCGSHLGHLFKDGPKPTGKRYCINSAVLDLENNNEE